jgi:predicted nucleic acid-binding protein
MIAVLDQAAVSALAGPSSAAKIEVRRVLEAAKRLRRDVVVPTVILAELYRGSGRSQLVDSLLSRESLAIDLRDTDRSLARLVGGVLVAAGAGSEDLADAHVVGTAVEAGGGIILTCDENDMNRLGAHYPTITVLKLPTQ